jgi:hypothetical protein
MEQEDRPTDVDPAPARVGPDTERSHPATPLPPTESLRIPAQAQGKSPNDASPERSRTETTSAPPTPRTAEVPAGTTELAAEKVRTLGRDAPTLDEDMPLADESGGFSVEVGTLRDLEAPTKSSSTTLQSMKRPEQPVGGVPHSRRFLRIENDLDQAVASIRLLEKSLVKAKNEARLAWVVALVAAALAGAALAL